MLSIPVGNVTAETELTYEYGARHKKRPSPPPDTTAGTTADTTAGTTADTTAGTTAEQQGAGVKSDAGQGWSLYP